MGNMKTPGVYIVEKNAFPNSVVEAPTAIPAFIGITETARNGDDDLTNVPWKISSMMEFVQYFGVAPELKFELDIKRYFYLSKEQKKDSKILEEALIEPVSNVFKYCVCPLEEKGKVKFDENTHSGKEDEANGEDTSVGYAFYIDGDNKYTLYYNMLLFFANGGSNCYVVSVGSYESKDTLDDKKVETGLTALEKIQEVTMIIVPEAVENTSCCANIQQLMLKHCGEMANRFTILDTSPKYPANEPLKTRMETFQGSIGGSYMSYGAAYFPWLNTSVISDRDIDPIKLIWSNNIFVYRKEIFGSESNTLALIETLMADKVTLTEGDDTKKQIGSEQYTYAELTDEVITQLSKKGVTVMDGEKTRA